MLNPRGFVIKRKENLTGVCSLYKLEEMVKWSNCGFQSLKAMSLIPYHPNHSKFFHIGQVCRGSKQNLSGRKNILIDIKQIEHIKKIYL